MKRYSFRYILLLAGLAVLVGVMVITMPDAVDASRPEALAVQVNTGSGFSFQGYLDDGGVPVNGTCHFDFGLFDRAQGGNQIGSVQELRGVDVIEGNFAVVLNEDDEFGDNAFNGQARWLEITVDCGRGQTMLSTRQELLAVPYAFSLRPGATISGNTPADTGILNLSGGDYGLRVLSSADDGISIENAGDDGVRVHSAGGDGIHARGSAYGGYFWGGTAGVNAAATSADGIDLVLSGFYDGNGEPETDGRISTFPDWTEADMYLLSNRSATVRIDADGSGSPSAFMVAEGEEPDQADDDVTHLRVDNEGVEARRFFATDLAGTFPLLFERTYFDASSRGVYALTETDASPDLVLGGTDEDTLIGDDGIISSEPGFVSSDIVLRSNDTVRIDLNANGDDEDIGSLEVYDDDGNLLFIVDTNGNVCIGNCSPSP